MVRNSLVTSLLASSAVIFAVATPALASKRDRAQEAIAAAEAKLHTAESLGTGVEVPAATAEARAALAHAREDLHDGHKSASIDEAIHASALADTAIGELQRRKNEALAATAASERATAAAAQDQVAAAHEQAATAKQQAETAQQQAAEANARADAAAQAAASSAADAEAARSAAAAAQTPPPPPPPTEVQTTVTTQHHGTAHHATRTKVVKRTGVGTSGEQVTTTTSVTQH